MRKVFLMSLLISSFSQFASAEVLKLDTAKGLAKFMKPSIDAKDAPATCWFLGQAHGYALALKNSGDTKAAKLFEMLKADAGKCGGKNTANIAETFTPEEWTRLSDLQRKIENFKL